MPSLTTKSAKNTKGKGSRTEDFYADGGHAEDAERFWVGDTVSEELLRPCVLERSGREEFFLWGIEPNKSLQNVWPLPMAWGLFLREMGRSFHGI